MVAADAEFQFGANHPLGDNAADAGGFEGFITAAVGVVKARTDLGKADFLTGGDIGRAANHFHNGGGCRPVRRGCTGAGVDLAEAQAVGVGMGSDLQHFADYAVSPAAGSDNFADLDAGHSQPVGQLLGRPVEVNIVFQPALKGRA